MFETKGKKLFWKIPTSNDNLLKIIKQLLQKDKKLEPCQEGIIIKISGEMKLNYKNEQLEILF